MRTGNDHTIDQRSWDRQYVRSVADVLRHLSPEMQRKMARHNPGWAPGATDFPNYLRRSSTRFHRPVHRWSAQGPIDLVDVGGFWGVLPLTLVRLGHRAAMTECLRYYDEAFDGLFDFLRGEGVVIHDLDPFDEAPFGADGEPPRRFRHVAAMAVLEHYPHSTRFFLRNLARLATDDAEFCIEVPNLAHLPRRLALLRGQSVLPAAVMIHDAAMPFTGHHHEYTVADLQSLLEHAGFEIRETICADYSAQNDFGALLWSGWQRVVTRCFPRTRETIMCFAVRGSETATLDAATASPVSAASKRVEARPAVAVSGYPVSRGFRERVDAASDATIEWTTLGDLRGLGMAGLLRWAIGGRRRALLVVSEVPEARILEPILALLAPLMRLAPVTLVREDAEPRRVGYGVVVRGALGLLRATIGCALAKRRAGSTARRLLDEPRQRLDAPPVPTGDAASAADASEPPRQIEYIKATLWFGVKAGGSVGHVAGVINAFVRRGFAVRTWGPAVPPMLDRSVRSLTVDPPGFGLPAEGNLYRYQPHLAKAMLDEPRTSKPALVYQRLSLADFTGALVARELGVPLVVEYNGSEAWIAAKWGRGLRFQKLAETAEDVMLRHAHAIVVVSDVLRDELLERGVEADRITTYPNCIDPRQFDPAKFSRDRSEELRASIDAPADAIIGTFVGTFGAWHGSEVLAAAIAMLATDHAEWLRRRKVLFCLVGDGLRMPDVRSTLERANAMEFVRLTGLVAQHEAPAYLAMSNFLLSPHVSNADGSRFFGSPTKLFEYMAMEKAIIASDLEQIGQVLRPGLLFDDLDRAGDEPASSLDDAGARGVLVPPGDAAALADAIRWVVEHPEHAAALASGARRAVLDRYTWIHHVDAILDTLRTSCSTPPR